MVVLVGSGGRSMLLENGKNGFVVLSCGCVPYGWERVPRVLWLLGVSAAATTVLPYPVEASGIHWNLPDMISIVSSTQGTAEGHHRSIQSVQRIRTVPNPSLSQIPPNTDVWAVYC
jgi:hypothetical protein